MGQPCITKGPSKSRFSRCAFFLIQPRSARTSLHMGIKSLHQVPLLNALPPLLSYGAPEVGLLGLEPIGRGDDATTVTQLEGSCSSTCCTGGRPHLRLASSTASGSLTTPSHYAAVTEIDRAPKAGTSPTGKRNALRPTKFAPTQQSFTP